ncbi:hypothetical protein AGDE_06867 [Angomonas deanei]|uniref:CRAL/TRIO domain containing protein, putative n=1 Tax=Angomonas deanei TaxID=59799 RepID=A0A7G2CQ03_9TRYP|nr:hypothetical protein AGDE_06867 [Angomonas deanei]CAD2221908.1 CRAL/TRIO domain containing protein, putative [Angomonas deanei]|eukprot:EPY36539.1 hypothetical protein AGDE_06867 [Angomonas deanei]
MASSPPTVTLEECIAQYEKDIIQQTHCCAQTSIPEDMKAANRRIFEKLVQYQKQIDAGEGKKESAYEEDSAARRKKHKDDIIEDQQYPENMYVQSFLCLKKVLPIPDIHKVSDCDMIYRFLIARRSDENLALQDIKYYLAFREKYDLNHILWDMEVEAMYNGLDGEELLQQTLELLHKKLGDKPLTGKDLEKFKANDLMKKIKIPRPLLQPGWAAWNYGVDKTGHVIYYQKPFPKNLALLEKRFKYEEGKYDARNPQFHSVTAPYANLLVRLYLRNIEKGRRLSRLMNYNKQSIIREDFKCDTSEYDKASNAKGENAFYENGGGMTCLVDVGSVKISHLTGSKCKDALRVFRLLSVMGQFYYPENMKRMIIVNAGFIFNMLFKMIRPWLDPQTQKKIILLSATNKVVLDDTNLSGSEEGKSPTSNQNEGDSEDDTNEANSEDFALRKALSEYIDDRYIPSFYGGKFQTAEAPLSYGGGVPKRFTQDVHYPLAELRIKDKVLPELLSDEFVMQHTEEGQPISEAEWNAYRDTLKSKF